MRKLRVKSPNLSKFLKLNLRRSWNKRNRIKVKTVSLSSSKFFLTKRNKIFTKILKKFKEFRKREKNSRRQKKPRLRRMEKISQVQIPKTSKRASSRAIRSVRSTSP